MPTRLPKIAAIVGTASVAALGAYAVGSQAGDGTASAAKGSSSSAARTADRDHGHGPFGLSGLADDLGVTEAQLEQALTELRDAHSDGRVEHAAALAKALGIDQAKVEAALAGLAPGDGRRGRWVDPVSALADALGIEEPKVEAAFEQLHEQRAAEMEAKRAQFAQELAAKLDISAEKVTEALDDGPFGGPGHGPRGPGGPGHGSPGFGRPAFGHP